MEIIKRNKTVQRASFTRAYNKLEDALTDDNVDHDEIEICLSLLKQKADTLEVIHNSYLDSLEDERDFETEFIIVEEYREKVLRIHVTAKRVLDNFKRNSSKDENVQVSNSCQLRENDVPKTLCQRLPEIEFYKFGGDLKDWLTFWNQFKNIHENVNLTNADKYHYLIQSTKIKSEARDLVESFPVTDENYSLAVASLQERYGRKDLLIDFYIRELLRLVLNNANRNNSDSLSCLYNKLSTQLRALNSLGVTSEMCGVILYPLVESSLPINVLRSFERQRKNIESEQRLSSLDAIIYFLKNEVQTEERIKLSRTDIFHFPSGRKNLTTPSPTSLNPIDRKATAAELISHNSNNDTLCVFCLKNHVNRFCKKAYFIPLDEKLSAVKKKGLCHVCLTKGHLAKFCTSNIKCPVCSRRHVKFMCPNLECNQPGETSKQDVNDNKEKVTDTLYSRVHTPNEVILQTLVVIVKGRKAQRKARIILDTGSQKSYIKRSTAEELGFEIQREEEFSHSLFGGMKTKTQRHNCYKIYLNSLDDEYSCSLDALDQDIICNDVTSIKHGPWMRELKRKKIFITDFQNDLEPIEVLLGADVVGKLFTGKREQLASGLVAIGTKLGWTLMGKVPQSQHQKMNMTVVNMLSQELPVSSLWDLELLGIRDPVEQSNEEDLRKAVMIHFRDTVQQSSDGRYEVSLPWKRDHALLPNNYELSLKRLESTYKKLGKTGYKEKYQQVFKEWIDEGVIEEVPHEELSLPKSHYLPHRPVIKETPVTSLKIRPVFDASAKIPNYPSLNDCLETGMNFIETIPSIFARFRLYGIGVISDIRRAFLQISLNENDRNFLRFLLYHEQDHVKTYRHRRVVFGLTSSPFLLMAVIHHHLSKETFKLQYSEELLDNLRNSFYVDNCVMSVQNVPELEIFMKTATEIMKEGQFDLRGWESNELSVCTPSSSETHVLGLIWNKDSDTLNIDMESLKLEESEKLTKRKILSLISRIFDPIGFLAPALIQPKRLLQETWKNKDHWDSEVNDDIKKKFLSWFKNLHYLNDVKISRWLGVTTELNLSLHTFVDASQTAYSACIFVRCKSIDGAVNVQLLQAKSRITPVKKITIPRLELMGATIGARLFDSMSRALKLGNDNIDTYFWTDSSTVLTWIKRQEQWSVFVNNRISEIRRLTAAENWAHVPGNQNPADLLSRGCGARQLLKSKWWLGPAWLKNSKEDWPKSFGSVNEEEVEREKRKTVVSASNVESKSIVTLLATRISKFSVIVRVLAWVLRFQPKAKDLRKHTDLTQEEVINAHKTLLRSVQRECFNDEGGKKSLKNFQAFIDNDNILRLKSRLANEDKTPEFIAPVILPPRHLVVRRLIEQGHLVNKHVGTSILLTILREKFWILKGRRTIRSVIKDCVTCKKQRVKNLEVPFAPLPRDRTTLSAVFEISGVDLAGPLITKSNEKVWIVLFSCAVYRAVHLELIPSLSTNAFIQALRKFIARRGRVSTLYSDNGTNFTALNTSLKKLDWTKIQREFEISQIRWKFNPPSAPWWGGFWERLIGILKDLLRKNLGHSTLTYEELSTLICECESVMNNRPLTYLSEEPDLTTLTPSSFLQDLPTNDVPDLDKIDKTNINKRYRYVQRLRETFKERFRIEYLGFLRSSIPKKVDQIKVGDVVLLGREDKRRLHWPLARVIELFPGRDGQVRLVKLKTSKGTLLRPVQRLYPLEVTESTDSMNINLNFK